MNETDRSIYRCPTSGRYHDPMAVQRALTISCKPHGFNAVLQDTRNPDEAKAEEAKGKMVAAARVALGLPGIDPKTGEGVPEVSVVEALTAFTRWLAGKGVTASAGPSGAPCTDCPPGR